MRLPIKISTYSRIPRWFFLLLILIATLLTGCTHSHALPPLDPDIDGMHQVRLLSGTKAVEAINRLHGMPIRVVRGFVADYKGPRDKATIWVSEAESEALAQHQMDVMIAKMKKNKRSPFRRYRTMDVQRTRVIGFDGMGQVHYVFISKAWVYWISADSTCIDTIVNYLLKHQ